MLSKQHGWTRDTAAHWQPQKMLAGAVHALLTLHPSPLPAQR